MQIYYYFYKYQNNFNKNVLIGRTFNFFLIFIYKNIMTTEEKKEKKRLYDIEYRKKNKEKLCNQKKEWVENNKEKISGYKKKT